jgi:hypothetical protein
MSCHASNLRGPRPKLWPRNWLQWLMFLWFFMVPPGKCSVYCLKLGSNYFFQFIVFLVVKGPAADATDAPQPWGFLCNPVMKMMMIIIIIFCPFPSSGAPVEWNWQGKTEVLVEKPVPMPLCPPQIPHVLTRDRTRASAVGGRRLTARSTVVHTKHSAIWNYTVGAQSSFIK